MAGNPDPARGDVARLAEVGPSRWVDAYVYVK